MNKNAIKNYAIWARNELITRVTQKAFEYGVSKDNIVDFNAESINGKLLNSEEIQQRQKLISEVKEKGFDQVMEEVAYTWFNRFIALRYMEVNNYLPNRVRVFTNENNEFKPQLLDEAATIELDGLDKEKVYELLENNKDEELYKLLLLATCNDMHNYLPGMFETIHDYKVILFPENLLRNESVLGKLVMDIDEDSWLDQVQIIGWLYQYYIASPKDELIHAKKQYRKSDVSFVTQLFTPDWIVKYMVENTLGRMWHYGHPDSTIYTKWNYYLEDTYQEDLDGILQQVKNKYSSFKPEDIKFMDPAMGSGHILVYAFEIFMEMYCNYGYSERDAAELILLNNLYGLDIDNRAYQLAYFALLMKARQYNRRILTKGISPNIYTIEESNNLDMYLFEDIDKDLGPKLYHAFYDAKEYGSILNFDFTQHELDLLKAKIDNHNYGLFENDREILVKLHAIAELMTSKYDVICTNPPYMSSSLMPKKTKEYVAKYYKDYSGDMFSVFFIRCNELLKNNGQLGFLAPYVWMFISTYEKLRYYIINNLKISSLVQLEYNAFEAACVPVASYTFLKTKFDFKGQYVKLSAFPGFQNQEPKFLEAVNNSDCKYRYSTACSNFLRIPGFPIGYWLKNMAMFDEDKLSSHIDARIGMVSGDNNRFLRLWTEVSFEKIEKGALPFFDPKKKKWYPLQKGGDYRLWYGNNSYVVNWENDGYELKNDNYQGTRVRSHNYNGSQQFKDGITWNSITSSRFQCRYSPVGFTFDAAGPLCEVLDKDELNYILGFLSSKVATFLFDIINPTLNFPSGYLGKLPLIIKEKDVIDEKVSENISISKIDWDNFETSWDFKKHPLIRKKKYVKDAYIEWEIESKSRFDKLKANEESINNSFIHTYGLQEDLSSNVEDKFVTVRKADVNRDIKSFISYAVGCMFGRYSLDVEGLAYAGGEWDNSKYSSFIPDVDNIIPICDDEYFEDDIVGRFIEFVKVVYGEETLNENLEFIAEALGGKGTPREILRNYFLNDFFKDHCATYQVTGSGKRPIYWLFDSGKKNGFKALIYIHRYTPDLIARMRTQYIHEQQARYRNQIEMLERQIDGDISTSERVRLNKQLKKFKEQDEELRKYEEKIHHWADRMEPMDLDDGVKANYAKFQELLAKIK